MTRRNFDGRADSPTEVDLTEPLYGADESELPSFSALCAAIRQFDPESIDVYLKTADGLNALVARELRVTVTDVGSQTLHVLFSRLPETVVWKQDEYTVELVDDDACSSVRVYEDGVMDFSQLEDAARQQLQEASE